MLCDMEQPFTVVPRQAQYALTMIIYYRVRTNYACTNKKKQKQNAGPKGRQRHISASICLSIQERPFLGPSCGKRSIL